MGKVLPILGTGRWGGSWFFQPPGWFARAEPRLARLDLNPAFFLLSLDGRARWKGWAAVLGVMCLAIGLGVFIGNPDRPLGRTAALVVGVVAGGAFLIHHFRSDPPISSASVNALWIDALRIAPITAEDLMGALWGASCRRGRMAMFGAIAASGLAGSLMLGLSPNPAMAVLSWMGAAWAGFALNYCLSPHPSLAGCRAIATAARARTQGLGGLMRRLLHLVALLLALASAMAVVGWAGYHLVVDGPSGVGGRWWSWAANRVAGMSPLARMSISLGVSFGVGYLSHRFFARRADANWDAGVEALRTYLRAATPRMTLLTLR